MRSPDSPRSVIHRYALIRDGTLDLPLSTCFTSAAEMFIEGEKLVGVEAISDRVRIARNKSRTLHHITTSDWREAEGGDVHATTYAFVFERPAEIAESVCSIGCASLCYNDHLVIQGEEWRIAKRNVSILLQWTVPRSHILDAQ